MNLFIDIHQLWIKNLISANVDFIIIGGYSVIFHGYKRTTGDIDIWLKPDNSNKERLLGVLRQFNYAEEDILEIAALDFNDRLVFSIDEAPEKIDFLTYINLVNYDDADKNKIIAEVDGMHIPFLHMNDLVLSKMNTGRPKDIADIDMLQKVEKERNCPH